MIAVEWERQTALPPQVSRRQRQSSAAALLAMALLAMAPMALVYLFHVSFAPAEMRPTGFLQYDQPCYMAMAREPYDAGTFSVYGLPFSHDYETPAIYVQPAFLLLGGIAHATRIDPGVIYATFGIVCGVVMFRLALALYTEFAGPPRSSAEKLAALSVLWGGGIVVLTGLGAELVAPEGRPLADRLFRFDPAEGYWLQNLGRNVFYSTEAFYHALFLGSVLLILGRRYGAAFAVMALTAVSHPFTGVQLLFVVSAFVVLEWGVQWRVEWGVESGARRRAAPPPWFAAGTFALLAAHLGYYLWFLNRASPEHGALQQQWAIPWVLPVSTIAAAYGPLAVAAATRFVRQGRAATMLGDQRVRFALVWAIVSLALAKHELFTTPHQPLHFTHGHIWTPLALLAAPVLAAVYARLLQVRPFAVGAALATALSGIVLVDNAVWFGRVAYLITQEQSQTVYVRRDLHFAFERLSEPDMAGRLLIASDEFSMYFATVYTPLRTWRSHALNTPHILARRAELDTYFAYGIEPESWRSRPMVALAHNTWKGAEMRLRASGFSRVAHFGRYEVMMRDPK